MTIDRFLSRLLRAPDGGGGAAAVPGAAPEGGSPGDPPPAGAAGETPDWWGALDAETLPFVEAKGLKGKPADEALKSVLGMYRNAEAALGKKGLPAPDKGQDAADWLAANREALGLPKDAAGYEVAPPEGFDEATWDKPLADRAAAMAMELAVPPKVHQKYVGLFAEYVQNIDRAAAEERTRADTEMNSALARDWGKDTDARIAGARQAAQRLAEDAGLDSDALSHVGAILSRELGGAPTLRLFDRLAQAMADDTIVQGGGGGGAGATADAQAQLSALMAPGGRYYEAVAKGNTMAVRDLMPEITRLQKQVSAAGKR